MSVLVDSSVWIEYFRNGYDFGKLDFLIDEDLVFTNDLILAELVPYLRFGNQRKIIALLRNNAELSININWGQISEFQYRCLKSGLNGVGIPDLIIAQNARQSHSAIYSLDNHFRSLRDIKKIDIYPG